MRFKKRLTSDLQFGLVFTGHLQVLLTAYFLSQQIVPSICVLPGVDQVTNAKRRASQKLTGIK